MAVRSSGDKAVQRYDAVHLRSEHLLDLYDLLRKPPHNLKHAELADLPRSALVLAVAGMDSYFTARFAECLVPYLKKHGPNSSLVELLAKAGLDTRQALEMINMQRPYRRIRTLMDAYFERFTTQRADVVDELFATFGLKNFADNAQRSVHRANLVRRVELMVERRHQIVHEGDLNDHGRSRKVDATAVRKQLRDLRLFITAAQQLSKKRIK